jgi:hypothetical protein
MAPCRFFDPLFDLLTPSKINNSAIFLDYFLLCLLASGMFRAKYFSAGTMHS